MRKLLIIAAPFAVLASPVAAQTATGTVDINGTVASRCLFTLPNKTISLGELALSSDGKLDVSKVNGRNETLAGWCNGTAASMTVTTTQLTNPVAAAGGFDNRVDYTATAVTGLVSANDTSLVAGAGGASAVNMFNGNIVVTLSAASSPTSGLMVAGNYTGNVVVTLTPTVAP